MIEDVILQALAPVFAPHPLIIANENGPRPTVMYATIRVETMNRLPTHVGMQDEEGARNVSAHRVGQIELQMFGALSYDTLDLGLQRLSHDANIEAFEAAGIVFGDSHDIENIPVLRTQTQFEPRAVVTLPFSYTRATEETLSWIETVAGTATAEGEIATGEISGPYVASMVDNP
jgi:hypothetical protein